MKAKHFFLMALCFVMAMPSMAQSSDFEDDVIDLSEFDKYQGKYRPNEVIVKFKDASGVNMRAPQRVKFAPTEDVVLNQSFASIGVDSIEELMPLSGAQALPSKVRGIHGTDLEIKSGCKMYRLKLRENSGITVEAAVAALASRSDVEYAEPNYITYAMASTSGDSATYVQEPMYSQNYGPEKINLPFLWNMPIVSTKRPVIAILDTGVDIDHPDLAANIWTNLAESTGYEGEDDDANGFVDDIHGWDFVNQTPDMHDYNGHGTHCAGIAAAVGNNGIGICGANPDALIMPISVLQSDGTGDIAKLVRGIDYAVANGADILSMSLGVAIGDKSVSVQTALSRAYSRCVLVGAIGLESEFVLKVSPSTHPRWPFCMVDRTQPTYYFIQPCYLDMETPMFSGYELRAPGAKILSTFPNGRYKILSGSSMACPLVAGAISRLMQCKPDGTYQNKERLFADLIHSRGIYYGGLNPFRGWAYDNYGIDIKKAYLYQESDRVPCLWLKRYDINDDSGDSDKEFDAGETVDFYPTLFNDWGYASNIKMWMKTGFYYSSENGDDFGASIGGIYDWVDDDTTLIEYLTDTVDFGLALNDYSSSRSINPIRFRISENCVDNRHINVTLFATCDGAVDTLIQHISIVVHNMVELQGMIMEDMTLYPDVNYLIKGPIAIPAGVTLTVMPGTKLSVSRNNPGISVAVNYKDTIIEYNGTQYHVSHVDRANSGRLIMQGTKDSVISIVHEESGNNGYYFQLSSTFPQVSEIVPNYIPQENDQIYMTDENMPLFEAVEYDPIKYVICDRVVHLLKLRDVVLEDCSFSPHLADINNFYKRCNIYGYNPSQYTLAYNCNLDENSRVSTFHELRSCNNYGILWNSSSNSIPEVFRTDYPSYYGSSIESTIREKVNDIENGYGFKKFDLSNRLNRPTEKAHGVLWKVEIDGYDAQDAFDSLPLIGAGTHRCDVYFNRPMDTLVTPNVTYGVRMPYTQHAVNENASWSADSTIYTAYFTITNKTASNGLNMFRVEGARDNEHFLIFDDYERFKMTVSATYSMSSHLYAEPGIGKVRLNWETDEEDMEDLLGYNLYKFTINDSGNSSDTVLVNKELIDSKDSTFTDYDVIPGTEYHYMLMQSTTEMEACEYSNSVSATPFNAQKGDANGSMTVDIADVITEINYLTFLEPKPFLFEAADVNSDNEINILDVIGTINIIKNPSVVSQSSNQNEIAYYYIENDTLFIESDAVLAGLQFEFAADESTNFKVLEALAGFETTYCWLNDSSYLFLAYSMSNRVIPIGKHALMTIDDARLKEIVISDSKGHNVDVVNRMPSGLDNGQVCESINVFPNPFSDEIHIQISAPEVSAARLIIHGLNGQIMEDFDLCNYSERGVITWHPKQGIASGMYFVSLIADGSIIKTEKIVYQK